MWPIGSSRCSKNSKEKEKEEEKKKDSLYKLNEAMDIAIGLNILSKSTLWILDLVHVVLECFNIFK